MSRAPTPVARPASVAADNATVDAGAAAAADAAAAAAGERAPLTPPAQPPGLTVDSRLVAEWPLVVSLRGPAVPGGRCAAIYYAPRPARRPPVAAAASAAAASGCCCCSSSSSNSSRRPDNDPAAGLRRVERDVDDPAAGDPRAAWRDLHGVPVLVVVNGAAGRGDAPRAVRDVLAGVFRDAGLDAVFRTTDRVGHAADLAAEAVAVGLHPGDGSGPPVAAVVAVGGDGTLHEVVNGLVRGRARKKHHPQPHAPSTRAARHAGAPRAPRTFSDQQTDRNEFPLVGVVPTGSGNAVAASLGVTSVLGAALNIVHALRTRSARPMTLMQYGRLAQRRLSDSAVDAQRESLSICGLQWGLLANVDLGTESLRWMGDTRYDVGAIRAIAAKRVQYARVRLRLHRTLQHDVDKRLERSGGGNRGRALERGGDQDVIIDGRFTTIVAWSCKYQSRTCAMTPYALPEEPCFDVVLCREGAMGRVGMLRSMLMLSQGNDAFLLGNDGFEYYKCKQLRFEALDGDYMSIDGESVPVEPCYLSIAPESNRIRFLDVNAPSGMS